MGKLIVVSHPEVVVAPDIPITDWALSETGRGRAEAFAQSGVLSSVGAIWSSIERKATETADILAMRLGLTVKTHPDLGENDRSATGFLPPPDFEAAADAFFAAPETSFQGWETALAAQRRIVRATTSILKAHSAKDIVLVTHGAVGTLLWCEFAGRKIDRQFDQPSQGHYWSADLETLRPECGWRSIA